MNPEVTCKCVSAAGAGRLVLRLFPVFVYLFLSSISSYLRGTERSGWLEDSPENYQRDCCSLPPLKQTPGFESLAYFGIMSTREQLIPFPGERECELKPGCCI